MRRLWWVRHAPTRQTVLGGWRDVPADLGDRAALARLDARLPAGAPVVSSDLLRARATADLLAAGRPRLPDDPALREFHHGDWEGRSFAEVAESHPELSRACWEEPGDHAPPGGESWNDVDRRVEACVRGLLAQRPEADLVAVAHHGVILTRVARALARPPREVLAQRIEPLSVTCLAWDGARWTALSVNHRP